MNSTIKISDFSEYLFWDVDKSKFDLEKNAPHLIHKVVEMGQLTDWENLLKLYGKAKIKDVVVELRTLNPVTLSFLSSYFKISQKEFRCYTVRQSVQNYWNS